MTLNKIKGQRYGSADEKGWRYGMAGGAIIGAGLAAKILSSDESKEDEPSR